MRLILRISCAACNTRCLDNCSAIGNAVNPRETKQVEYIKPGGHLVSKIFAQISTETFLSIVITKWKIRFTGINTYHYKADLGDMSTNPKEKCFCPAPDNCLTKNLMDLTKCVGVPLIASLPHLLGAEEKYLEMVDGLHPNEARICNSYSRYPRRATAYTYFRFKNPYFQLILANAGYRYRCARTTCRPV